MVPNEHIAAYRRFVVAHGNNFVWSLAPKCHILEITVKAEADVSVSRFRRVPLREYFIMAANATATFID